MVSPRAHILLSILLVIAMAGCSDPPPNCSLIKVARLPLRMDRGMPLVPVVIDGSPAWLVADTGAERTILTEGAVARFGLEPDIGHVSHTMGIGGPTTSWDVVVNNLTMGGVHFPVDRFAVGHFHFVGDDQAAPAGLLGADILMDFDLDIDAADGSITLYRARRCPDARPPWDDKAVAVSGVVLRKDRLMVPLTLDGATTLAVLDTGARRTTIGSAFTERLGITEDRLATDPVVMQHGAGPAAVVSHLHRFGTLAVGPVIIHDPALTVVPSGYGVGDALVGQDFLQGRKVWISFATRQVFVTPLPGDAEPQAER